ncbi:MAG: hypothetical protein M0036_14225 [Desulfobacteraceae bacterium]|nr:hypothetical protein [Desulfobacteraceae bacterium]
MLQLIARFSDGRELGTVNFDFIKQSDPIFQALVKDFEAHGYTVEVFEIELASQIN